MLLPSLEALLRALLLLRKDLALLLIVRPLFLLDLCAEGLRARVLLVRGLNRLVVARGEELGLRGLEGLLLGALLQHPGDVLLLERDQRRARQQLVRERLAVGLRSLLLARLLDPRRVVPDDQIELLAPRRVGDGPLALRELPPLGPAPGPL